MIIEQKQINVVKTDGLEEITCSLDESNFPLILEYLRKDIYSSPIDSCVREIISNAWDANVEAGNETKPILIKCPNHLEPNWCVRDYGNGMSKQDVANVLFKFGCSTKRNTNTQIGSRGLGAKSPWAVGDSFSIISYHNGFKTNYLAYIDESNMGKVAVLDCSPSAEPSGVEIVVPVKTEDFDAFQQKTVNMVKYFKVKPTVIGGNGCIKIDDTQPELCGDGWCYKKNASTAVAIMGCVAYGMNVHDGSLYYKLTDKQRQIIQSGFEIEFAIGEIETTISRESLQYTEKTVNAICDKTSKIIEELPKILSEGIKNCACIYDAKMFYLQAQNGLPHFARGIAMEWNGKKIEDGYITIKNGLENHIYVLNKRNKRRGGGKIVAVDKGVTNFYCRHKNFIVGSGQLKNLKGRAETYFANHPNVDQVYMLDLDNPHVIKEFETQTGLSTNGLDDLGNYQPPAVVRAGRTSNGTVINPRNAKRVLQLNFTKLEEYVSTKYSGYLAKSKINDYARTMWDIVDVDMTEDAVYIPIERYHFADGTLDAKSICSFLSELALFGIDMPKVYGVKKSFDIPKNWIPIDKYVKDVCDELAQDTDLVAELANVKFAKEFCSLQYSFGYYRPQCQSIIDYMDKMKKYQKNGANTYGTYTLCRIKTPKSALSKQRNEIFEKYPFLGLATSHQYDSSEIKLVNTTIAMLDKQQ